jgi:hypothetical protein
MEHDLGVIGIFTMCPGGRGKAWWMDARSYLEEGAERNSAMEALAGQIVRLLIEAHVTYGEAKEILGWHAVARLEKLRLFPDGFESEGRRSQELRNP